MIIKSITNYDKHGNVSLVVLSFLQLTMEFKGGEGRGGGGWEGNRTC